MKSIQEQDMFKRYGIYSAYNGKETMYSEPRTTYADTAYGNTAPAATAAAAPTNNVPKFTIPISATYDPIKIMEQIIFSLVFIIIILSFIIIILIITNIKRN